MGDKRYMKHPRNYGKDSRICRICQARRGVIQKYNMIICRKCFRENAALIGFQKVIFLSGIQ
jgi:small subunit ribosomal protein S29e